MTNAPNAIQQSTQLRCPVCGNDTRFIQVMEHVENLVDGDRNHLHLLIGIPDYYQCRDCGERIEDAAS
jgi:hypothetical protein